MGPNKKNFREENLPSKGNSVAHSNTENMGISSGWSIREREERVEGERETQGRGEKGSDSVEILRDRERE